MEKYKEEFINFMVDSNVLKFGDFTLKSGRKSPFFIIVAETNKKKISLFHECRSLCNRLAAA